MGEMPVFFPFMDPGYFVDIMNCIMPEELKKDPAYVILGDKPYWRVEDHNRSISLLARPIDEIEGESYYNGIISSLEPGWALYIWKGVTVDDIRFFLLTEDGDSIESLSATCKVMYDYITEHQKTPVYPHLAEVVEAYLRENNIEP